MSRKYFGTDGVRGRVGELPITPEFVLRLGHAAGRVLASHEAANGGRPAVMIGKDTRISGYMLESALEAGRAGPRAPVVPGGAVPRPGAGPPSRALRLSAWLAHSAA